MHANRVMPIACDKADSPVCPCPQAANLVLAHPVSNAEFETAASSPRPEVALAGECVDKSVKSAEESAVVRRAVDALDEEWVASKEAGQEELEAVRLAEAELEAEVKARRLALASRRADIEARLEAENGEYATSMHAAVAAVIAADDVKAHDDAAAKDAVAEAMRCDYEQWWLERRRMMLLLPGTRCRDLQYRRLLFF